MRRKSNELAVNSRQSAVNKSAVNKSTVDSRQSVEGRGLVTNDYRLMTYD